MNKMLWVIVALILNSCEKNINFNLEESVPVLVVDARIENSQVPVVVLTKSQGYFNEISPDILINSFVRNAEVTISNGTLSHRLKEYAYSIAPGFTAYYYSIDSSSLSTAFDGALNTSYQLQIISEGKEYTARTNIPGLNTVPDSVYFKMAPQNPDTNKRVMMIKATDPPGLGNYVRYFTKTNSNPFYPGYNSVYSDEVIDGVTYEVQLPQGVDKNNTPQEEDIFFLRSDTVTIKFCNIDRATYTFWSTWEFAYQGIGNPFAQPNKVLGNISNGALGAFCGYAAWYRTVIVQ
jgi:hypothetical protein